MRRAIACLLVVVAGCSSVDQPKSWVEYDACLSAARFVAEQSIDHEAPDFERLHQEAFSTAIEVCADLRPTP